jgi:hypothetical protein
VRLQPARMSDSVKKSAAMMISGFRFRIADLLLIRQFTGIGRA